MTDLKDKIIIITGGSGLLGKQYVKAVNELNGIPIVLDIQIANDSDADMIICDITHESEVMNAAYKIDCKYAQPIYGLINNAAIDPKFQKDSVLTNSRLENYDLDQWNKEIAVGLTGAFLCTKIFAPEMAKMGQGSIINISSVLGLVAPNQALYEQPGVKEGQQNVKPVTYSVIKHGIIGLTRYTASYYGSKNVRCNALAPGGVFNNHSDDFVERLSRYIPLGRMAKVDEYNEALKFLLTDASSFMTGSVLTIDGGQTTW